MTLKYKLPYYVRVALGLRDFDSFANEARLLNNIFGREEFRRTGRTTRMLVKAIYFSQNRKVYIAGCNFSYTMQLVRKASDMCSELGISDENIRGVPLNESCVGICFAPESRYIDHYEGTYIDRNVKHIEEFMQPYRESPKYFSAYPKISYSKSYKPKR